MSDGRKITEVPFHHYCCPCAHGLRSEVERLRGAAQAAIGQLEETRWTPLGALSDWERTGDGRNHGHVWNAMAGLRAALSPREPAASPKGGTP